MSDMVKIFSTPEEMRISMAESILNEAGIESFRMNKKDSSYLMFGNYELYTKADVAKEAYELLKESEVAD